MNSGRVAQVLDTATGQKYPVSLPKPGGALDRTIARDCWTALKPGYSLHTFYHRYRQLHHLRRLWLGHCIASTDRDASVMVDPSAFDIERVTTDYNDVGFVWVFEFGVCFPRAFSSTC